jgi:hypothetical protein
MFGLFFLVLCFGFSLKDFASVSINSRRWNVNKRISKLTSTKNRRYDT